MSLRGLLCREQETERKREREREREREIELTVCRGLDRKTCCKKYHVFIVPGNYHY